MVRIREWPGTDICLGVARFSPKVEESHNGIEDPNTTESKITELNEQDIVSHQEWLEVKHGSGKIRVSVSFSENKTHLLQMQDFDILELLADGSSGKTMRVKRKD